MRRCFCSRCSWMPMRMRSAFVLRSSIQPVPHMHLGWMVSLLELLSCAGRNKIPVKSCISRWLLLCEAVGMGSRSCKLYRTNCPDMEGVRYWLGRRMLHWRTLPSTRNAASACMRSDATILRIFSHLCWSTGSYFVICWCCVMTWNDRDLNAFKKVLSAFFECREHIGNGCGRDTQRRPCCILIMLQVRYIKVT